MRKFLHAILSVLVFTASAKMVAAGGPASGRPTFSTGEDAATAFTFEAECASVGTDWLTVQDPSASSDRFVVYRGLKPSSARPSGAEETLLRFTLEDTRAGQYNLFARAQAEDPDENDLWVRVNDGDWLRWEGFTSQDGFAWNPLSTTPLLLDEGRNTVDVVYKSVGIQIDKIHVDVDGSLPSGEGEIDPGCPDLPQNDPPVAVASATPTSGNAPLNVTFDGSGSSDSDGNIVSYSWNTGAETLPGNSPATTFSLAGTYVVTLTVTDDDGATDTDEVTVTVLQGATDSDGDGVADGEDNCPNVANPDQELFTFYADTDGDGFGDPAVSVQACEAPEGYVANGTDTCPGVSNPDQELFTFYADTDGDGFGDPAVSVQACEAPEGYVANADDNCPDTASDDLTDSNGDGIGDVCDNPNDNDSDNDGVVDFLDCDPLDPNLSYKRIFFADLDNDGIGDTKDYVFSCLQPEGYVSRFGDNCPDTFNPSQADSNGDGIGDACTDPVLSDGNYWLEGECATLSTGWAEAENTLASNDTYVLYRGIGNPTPPTETYGGSQIEMTVDVVDSDTYHLFFRMNAWRSSSNSFWVQVDDGPWLNFSKFIGGTDIATSGFQWVKVNDEGTDISFTLEAGLHTLRVANRSSYTMLDKVLLSTTRTTPSGLGGLATNCPQNSVVPEEPGLEAGNRPAPPAYGGLSSEGQANLELFPNPVSDRFSFRLSSAHRGDVTVILSDANGRKIRKLDYLKSDGELQDEIDVSQLPLGTYTLQILEGNQYQIRKFVKLR